MNTLNSGYKIICTVINDLTTDQRMHRICRTLCEAGHEVTLVGRILPNSKPLQEYKFHQKRLKCIWNKGFLFYMEYNIRLTIWLMFQKVDILNAIDLDTILPCWIAARLKGKKVVYDAHEWFPYVPEVINRPRVHKFWLKMESFFVPKMDAVYTVSESIAKEFSARYQKNVVVIRNMPKSISVKKEVKEKYILYQGALNTGRGLEELIDVMPDLNVSLYIAGGGDIEKELRQKVHTLSLKDKVQFLGKLTPEELAGYTQNAYIGVNLLQNLGLNYYYSLANKFFDYVQAEVPQISMDFPEYNKMNSRFEVAILIPNLDKTVLKSALEKLLNDSDYYNHLKKQCQKAAEKWNWETEEKNLLEIYEQL